MVRLVGQTTYICSDALLRRGVKRGNACLSDGALQEWSSYCAVMWSHDSEYPHLICSSVLLSWVFSKSMTSCSIGPSVSLVLSKAWPRSLLWSYSAPDCPVCLLMMS